MSPLAPNSGGTPIGDAEVLADQIRVGGYCVLENLLSASLIDEVRDSFDRLLDEHRRDSPTNRGANRYQMYLPFEPPFANPLVYENETALAVIEKVLGPDPICTYFASDTPLPGSDYQRVHSDTRLLFPDTQLSLPPYGLVLNIPLVDFTEENGPLEVWPGGTHLWPGTGDMQELAANLPSVRILLKAGSALLRDLRMWHRGTPNRGVRSRPNMALAYTRPWYRFEQKPPVISRARWDGLSERAQKMLRYSMILD